MILTATPTTVRNPMKTTENRALKVSGLPELVVSSPKPPDMEPGAMTIAEFCARYHINRVTLYKMRRDGIGPNVLLIGRKVLITYRAALEWQENMIERSNSVTVI
jgi:hypothetical protein